MRATNRIVATVVALVLLAASAITVVEIILAALGKSPWIVHHVAISDNLHERTWQNGWVRVVAVGAIVVGFLLVLVAFKRGAASDIPLQSDDPGVALTVTRKSLESYVAGLAEAEAGVDSSSAKARQGRVGVNASTTLRDPGDLKERVQHSVSVHLESLRLAQPVKTTVSIRSRES